MKLDAFCAWGDGPDVGINFTRTEEEAKQWATPHLNFFYELTAKEARELSAKLVAYADQADELERCYQIYCEALWR